MRSIHDIPLIGIGIGLIVVVGLIAGVGGIVISDDRPPVGQAPPINNTTTAEVVTQSQSESVNEPPQTYAVTAQSANAIDTQQLAEYGEVGTQADERVEVTMSPSDVSTVQNISWVTDVRPVIRPEPAQTDTDIPGSSDGESLGVQQAHENGITGEDVEVGIIDAGFDPNNQAIASNVVDTQSFRSSGGDPAHGTSVAEIVTQTAPDSQLYLVSASTGTDTEAAIDYLRRQGVDIIIHSVVFFAFEDNEDHIFTDNINAATESGTLFVNAAGNRAQTHWEGEFRDNNDNDVHEWTDGDELNCLPNCDTEYSGSIIVYVRWSDQDQESHYRPALFNPETDDFIRIGGERVFTTPSGTKYTVLTAEDVQSQPVDLVVDRVSGPADDEIEVVVDGPQEIERNVPASSISAPADVPAALSVAAYEVGPRRLAPYSSRGPTDDGRTGIDVTGYTKIQVVNGLYGSDEFIFTGTSAAAPYVGGVAALIEENQAGDQSPTEVTNTLRSSSDDILDPGIDTASGSGVVNAADAVDVAEGTLTGEIRGQEDTLIEDVGLEVSLERQTTTGGFEQIRAPRQVSDGQYTFDSLATGEEYRVIAGFQGETGSATIESLSPGTNTRDVVIPEVTLAEETPPDVTQTVSSSEVAPGEKVSVTTRISNLSGRNFEANITYSPPVQSAIVNVTADDGEVLAEDDLVENTSFISIAGFGDLRPRDTIILNQVATVPETAGTTHEVAGTITSGGTTTQIEPVTVTVTEQDSSSSSEIDVTQTVSSSEVAPGENVSVTTRISNLNGRDFDGNITYSPPVQSVKANATTTNGAVVDEFPLVENENTGSIGFGGFTDVEPRDTIIINQVATVSETAGTTHEVAGTITSGGTTAQIEPVTVTVTEQDSSSSSEIDVTQTVSSSEVAPGENVSVTTRISNLNGRDFDGNITYSPPVQSVKANATTTNGAVVDEFPLVENENTGSIGFGGFTDVEPRDTIIINQVATVSETAGTTHEVAGTITSGGTTAQIEPVTVTVTEQDSSSSSEIDVTRTPSSSEVSPDEQVTVTTEITGVSGAVSMSSSYDPQVASATVQSVTVNGASASPIIATAQSGESVVTLGDVGTDATVTVTEKLTVGDETGVTHSITGNVTAGETTTEFDPVLVTVTDIEPQSVVDEYAGKDGKIQPRELLEAIADFRAGELQPTDVLEIIAAFRD